MQTIPLDALIAGSEVGVEDLAQDGDISADLSIGVLPIGAVGSSFEDAIGSLSNVARIAGGTSSCGLVESSAKGVYIIADVIDFVLPSSTGHIFHVTFTKIVKFKTLVATGAPSCVKVKIFAKGVNR